MTKTAQKAKRSDSLTNAAPEAASEAEALFRVRELLFGETARDQSQQLNTVQERFSQETAALREEHQAEMAELRAQFQRELESLRWQIGDLAKQKLNRKDLGAMLAGVSDQLAEVG